MGCCVVHLDLVLGQVDLHRCELKIIQSALHVTIYSFRILDMGLKRAEMPLRVMKNLEKLEGHFRILTLEGKRVKLLIEKQLFLHFKCLELVQEYSKM